MRTGGVFLAVLVFVSAGTQAAATEEVRWSVHVPGAVVGIDVGADGSIYVAGERLTDEGTRMLTARYGPGGALRWREWRPAPPLSARATSVAAAPDGGAYVGAVVWRQTSVETSSYHGVIRRYTASGGLLWAFRIPLPDGAIVAEVAGLAADERGVVAAIDFYASTNYGGVFHEGEVWAFDPAGHVAWRDPFEVRGISGTFDGVGDVAIGASGSVYAAGHVDRTHRDDLNDPPSDEDLVLQRFSRGGVLRWSRTLSDAGAKDRDDAESISARAGLVVVGGYVDGRPATLAYQHAERARAWVGAFDAGGERLWSHRWGDRTPSQEVTSVLVAPWGPVYVGSVRDRYGSDPASSLRRYDADGTLVEVRPCSGTLVDVASSDEALFVATASRLERWRR